MALATITCALNLVLKEGKKAKCMVGRRRTQNMFSWLENSS